MKTIQSTSLNYPSEFKFDIRSQGIQHSDGTISDKNKTVIDMRTGRKLYDFVTGGHYNPIPHYKVFDMASEELARNFKTDNITVTDNLDKHDAHASREIIFNDYSANIKASRKLHDTMSLKAKIVTSLDGLFPMRITFSIMRLACLNGMITPDNFINASRKHTTGFDMNVFAKDLNKRSSVCLKTFSKDIDLFKVLAKSNVKSILNVEHFFKRSICLDKSRSYDIEKQFNNELFERMMREYRINTRFLGNTAWSVYNTLTHYSTHAQDSRWLPKHGNKSNDLRVVDLREKAVAKTLESRAWFDFLNTCSVVQYN
tara:strand:+ start:1519 stop:2460 length:942 start_codon:yes stop_codon:yes gene_type:complete